VFNIKLNYNINQAPDLKEWDGDFHTTFLHGSIEHLASDVKNIKDSLYRMEKYIKDKAIIDNNPNKVKDLEGVSKAIWEFLSTVYNSHWDGLYMNDSKTSLRNKVKTKFILQIQQQRHQE